MYPPNVDFSRLQIAAAVGTVGAVEKMIVAELIPRIDRTYPTLAQAQSRAVVGFSMGGAGAVRLSVMHPELFAAAVSMGGRAGAEVDAAAEKQAPMLKQRQVGFLLITGRSFSVEPILLVRPARGVYISAL